MYLSLYHHWYSHVHIFHFCSRLITTYIAPLFWRRANIIGLTKLFSVCKLRSVWNSLLTPFSGRYRMHDQEKALWVFYRDKLCTGTWWMLRRCLTYTPSVRMVINTISHWQLGACIENHFVATFGVEPSTSQRMCIVSRDGSSVGVSKRCQNSNNPTLSTTIWIWNDWTWERPFESILLKHFQTITFDIDQLHTD